MLMLFLIKRVLRLIFALYLNNESTSALHPNVFLIPEESFIIDKDSLSSATECSNDGT